MRARPLVVIAAVISIAVTGAIVGACSLNPQPLPPADFATTDTSTDAGGLGTGVTGKDKDAGGNGLLSDAAAVPTELADGGDASTDANADASEDAASDASQDGAGDALDAHDDARD